MFSLTQSSILSVASTTAPAITTSPSTLRVHERPYVSWWKQWESLRLLCVKSTDSRSELICTYTQELDVLSPDRKISLLLLASNTPFVIVVSFSNS